jgi:poly-gamma-glutamate capsule biosynthesis protein CapA/YwtB (metallophosphatase superfamily)
MLRPAILNKRMQYGNYQNNQLAPPPEPQRRSYLKIALVVLACLLVFFLVWHFAHRHHDTTKTGQSASKNSAQAKAVDNSSISFLATGDWIAHDSVNTAAKQSDGSYNYLPLVSDFDVLFKKTDVRFCNDPILNGGQSLGITGYPKFNSPTDFVTDMGRLGCNLVNTASNHSFDFTQANITNSVDAWSKVPDMLAVAGQNRSQHEHDTVHYFTVKGVKFAFLAYTAYINTDSPAQNPYGVNVFTQDFATQQISEAKKNGAQFIIASMRWGTEYSTSVDSEQRADAQFLADKGVNLVLGHGSHELQTVGQLSGSGGNKTLVWYSLGNFLNTQEPPETLFNGIADMTIDTKTLAIKAVKYSPVYMHYEWSAAQAAADDTNSRHTLHLYPLEKATQAMVDAQQLKTTIDAQKQRIQTTLNADGLNIPLVNLSQF